MNKFEFDNNNTIVNFANSILKHYGATTYHSSIPEVDKALQGHKKVVVMLFDGLGTAIRKYHLNESSNLNSHFLHKMNATYPPTTAASTTGCLSGKFPIENGWLGWRQYYDDLGCNILVFRGQDADSDTEYKDEDGFSIHYDRFPYKTIIEQIHDANKDVVIGSIFPHHIEKKGPKSLRGYRKQIRKFLKNKDDCLLYAYDTQPDTDMHEFGVHSKQAHKRILGVDKLVGKVAKDNKDTLFLVIADHGLVDVKNLWVFEHQDLVDTFRHQPSLEGRTAMFFIKDKDKEKFVGLFNKYYGDEFTLITTKEALDMHMFGEGNTNKKILNFFGDYLAIATKEYCFNLDKKPNPKFTFKAHHAGYTKDEMEIDISALNV